MLKQINQNNFLVDWFDFQKNKSLFTPKDLIILDSGAYKVSRGKAKQNIDAYLNLALNYNFFGVVAPDVINNNQATLANWSFSLGWLRDRRQQLPLIPVWQYESNIALLQDYLSQSSVVGIGGLVKPMRDNNLEVFQHILSLVQRYPDRLHLFGLNWLWAYSQLQPWTWGTDTSKWLCGFKTRRVIF